MALPLALLFVLAVGTLLEFVVYRPLRNTSPLARLVASLGVLLIAQSSMLLAFGVTQQPAPSVLPTKLIHMLGSGITLDRFLLAAIVIAATAVLAAVYQWTKFGLATRAASENEVAAMLGGVSPGTISLSNSLIAAFIAGSLGILASSVTQLDPETLPLQIIPALAAALIARFTSFGLVTVAAFGIGILDSLLQLRVDRVLVPAVRRGRDSRHDGPARVPHHHRRAVLARRAHPRPRRGAGAPGCRRRRGRSTCGVPR